MAKPTRVVSVVGKKNSGKTTLVVALAQEWARKGYHVATIKHGSHPATLDTKGTDTWRHMHEGNARRTLIDAPGGRVMFEPSDQDSSDPVALVRRYMRDMDMVIVEGYTSSDLPKVEVFRAETHEKPRYDESLPNADRWIAIVTDGALLDVTVPHFRFSDTGLLVTLTAIAWDGALVLET